MLARGHIRINRISLPTQKKILYTYPLLTLVLLIEQHLFLYVPKPCYDNKRSIVITSFGAILKVSTICFLIAPLLFLILINLYLLDSIR